MPRDHGLADIHDYRDLEVIAVNMPNEPGVRNVDWHTYITTVDAIEALTGYDLLALLPDDVEAAVESSTQPPLAAIDGSDSAQRGRARRLSAPPPRSIRTAHRVATLWDFGDGATGSGVSVSHTFAQDGTHVSVCWSPTTTGSSTPPPSRWWWPMSRRRSMRLPMPA